MTLGKHKLIIRELAVRVDQADAPAMIVLLEKRQEASEGSITVNETFVGLAKGWKIVVDSCDSHGV